MRIVDSLSITDVTSATLASDKIEKCDSPQRTRLKNIIKNWISAFSEYLNNSLNNNFEH